MSKNFDSFIRYPETFPDGVEVKFMVRDCTNYRYIPIKGKIFKDLNKAPKGSHNLWLRDPLGMKSKKPWGLQIIEEFNDMELFNTEFHQCAPKE